MPGPPPNATEEPRTEAADGSWMLWTALGVAGIWVAVILISVFAPDFVSGSEQEHQPVAAFTTWFWGGVATVIFLWAMGKLRGNATWRPTWIGLAIATLAVWTLAAIIGIAGPIVETGSDPTRIPIGAFVAPIAAAMLTAMAGVVANVFRRGPPDRGYFPRTSLTDRGPCPSVRGVEATDRNGVPPWVGMAARG